VAEYDSQVIAKFANRLYAQAGIVRIVYPIAGAVLGGFIASVGKKFDATEPDLWDLFGPLLLGGLLFGVLGFLVGVGKAFSLKLQAQIALCQMKIEQNTSRKI